MKMVVYTLRGILKFKGKMFTRVASLTLGLIAGLLLFTYNAFELSYDRFQPEGDRIYRVGLVWNVNGKVSTSFHSYAPLADAMKSDFPEVEAATCICYEGNEDFQQGNEIFTARTIYADTSFFDLFSYPLLSGSPSEELGVKENVFISKRVALGLFGSVNVVGSRIRNREQEWIVAGVFEDISNHSHLIFDVVKPLKAFKRYMGWHGNDCFYSYIRVAEGVDPMVIENSSQVFLSKYVNSDNMFDFVLDLQPLHRLYSYYSGGEVIQKVVLLGLLAVIVLVVSGVNYVLLSMASLSSQAKVVGIHRVSGATNGDIFWMFIRETGLLLGLALLFAIGILLAVRGVIEAQMHVSPTALLCFENWWIVGVVMLILFLLAGVLPAHIFTSLTVMQINRQGSGRKKGWKHFMLGFQFAMTIFLIAFLFVLSGQYRLLLTKYPGFEVNDLYFVRIADDEGMSNGLKVREELKRLPFVKEVGISEYLPDNQPAGMVVRMDEAGNHVFSPRWLPVDEGFLDVMEIPMVSGKGEWRNEYEAIVNQEFIRKLNLSVGQDFMTEYGKLHLSGICRDFQIGGFYNVQLPVILTPMTFLDGAYLNVFCRVDRRNFSHLEEIEKCIRNVVPDQNVELWAYTDYLKQMYGEVYWMQRMVLIMVVFVLIITVLGLVGYAADEIDRRTKEIAIRKVNGAFFLTFCERCAVNVFGWLYLPCRWG